MPVPDIYHNAVKNALIEDGWKITADPYQIKHEDAELLVDSSAEKPFAAEKNGRKIVVLIKSFLGASLIKDFETALGQYVIYSNLIDITEPEYTLYLAIKESTYENFFKRSAMIEVVKANQVLMFVVNIETEEILQWIN
jgi:hypothetical protein